MDELPVKPHVAIFYSKTLGPVVMAIYTYTEFLARARIQNTYWAILLSSDDGTVVGQFRNDELTRDKIAEKTA